jgi:hypothetical protein
MSRVFLIVFSAVTNKSNLSLAILSMDSAHGDQKVSLGEPWVRLTRAYAAQGGVTLGLEQGELGANFCHLGEKSLEIRGHMPALGHAICGDGCRRPNGGGEFGG